MTAKDLKNALLQEAVQGKLVPQIASEGNARDLLEEIRKEKLSHGLDFANAKSGKRKSKKETALAGSNPCGITEEEIPFDIPENWCWCRLSDIGKINRGRSQHRPRNDISLYENGTIPFIQTGDVAKANGIILEPKTFYNEKGLSQSKLWKKGTICLTIAANIGDVAVLNFDACFPDSIVGFNGYEKVSDNKYVMYTLMWYKDLLDKLSHSTAQKNINLEILSKIAFPLPPLSEQKRIVVAIEKFMPLIEEYGKKESALKAINEQIGALTKKAILQEAVQGKLVPQIASEGNAKDLVEEIRNSHTDLQIPTESAGKKSDLCSKSQIRVTKKSNVLPEITEDEIPFDIPENWCWCRLGEICKLIDGEKVKEVKLPLLDAKYLRGKKDATIVSEGKVANVNDLLILVDGENSGEVFVNKEKGIMGSTFKQLCICEKLYLPYILKFIEMHKDLLRNSKKGAAIPHLNKDIFFGLLLPLPPLSEQKRIVTAIEKILPLCEKVGE